MFTKIDEITGGDQDKKHKLLELFTNNITKCTSSMEEAVKNNDLELWQQNAHTLKGSSLALGFNEIADICEEIHDNIDELKIIKIRQLKDSIYQHIPD